MAVITFSKLLLNNKCKVFLLLNFYSEPLHRIFWGIQVYFGIQDISVSFALVQMNKSYFRWTLSDLSGVFRNNIIYKHKSHSFGDKKSSQHHSFFIWMSSLNLRSGEHTEIDIMHKIEQSSMNKLGQISTIIK